MALNHQGFGEAVPAEASLKVPVTTPEQTVQAYAEAILKIADPAVRARLSLGARDYIAQLGWLRRAEEMTDLLSPSRRRASTRRARLPTPGPRRGCLMKILLVHNYYQQPGGEDMVFKTESELLQQHGHTVLHETVHNDATRQLNPLTLAGKTIWNHDAYRRFRELVRREKPDVAHFHNTFPLLSPLRLLPPRATKAPAVVQTLHNYRLVCPGATLFREGRPCEDCLTRSFKTPAIQHSCYRGSRAATLATTSLLGLHQAAGTWAKRRRRLHRHQRLLRRQSH